MNGRISKLTPSFDPRDPPWDLIHDYGDGRFMEYGTRGLNRYDCRLTYVIFSGLPRTSVSIVGRALEPKQIHSDFLSIRLGSGRTKIVPLSMEKTAFINISRKGQMKITRVRKDFDEFRKELPTLSFRISPTETLRIEGGFLTLSDAGEQADAGKPDPAAS